MTRSALALLLALLVTGPVASATAPVSPRLPALPGAGPVLLPGATDVGPARPGERQRIDLSLARRDPAALEALLARQQDPRSPLYRQWLTPQQFAARFAPRRSAVDQVRRWARAAGLRVDAVGGTVLVSLSGTRAELGRAFGVRLREVLLPDGTRYVTPDRAGGLPAPVRPLVGSVVGLTTLNGMRTWAGLPGQDYQTYGDASYAPQDLAEVYRAPSSYPGTGQSVAVLTDGDLRQVARDLAVFEATFKLRRVPLTVRPMGPQSASRQNNLEYDLDTQWSLAFAPGAREVIAYNGEALGSLWSVWGFVAERRARTASGSFGGCEALNDQLGYVDAADELYRQALAQGQTLWFSSGDYGSSCYSPRGPDPVETTAVNYPASSRYVVAVGGTSLSGLSLQPAREIGWTGSGGGISAISPAPSWQRSAGLYERTTGRGVPDISLNADPYSGFAVFANGRRTTVGGTSASTPAWNGIWARVLQRAPRTGFAAPVLYRLPSGPLVDITVGTNGLWQVTPGYDLVTGLGSPDITGLLGSIR